jgi:hypothetical protein
VNIVKYRAQYRAAYLRGNIIVERRRWRSATVERIARGRQRAAVVEPFQKSVRVRASRAKAEQVRQEVVRHCERASEPAPHRELDWYGCRFHDHWCAEYDEEFGTVCAMRNGSAKNVNRGLPRSQHPTLPRDTCVAVRLHKVSKSGVGFVTDRSKCP